MPEAHALAAAGQITGKVFLVGAGPGDPGLITVKGLNCLRRADVVLFDRLVALELLDEARPDAELIDVGKEPKRHSHTQDEINALLVAHAQAGRQVVRLKGGDPFVFGRGGEECLALAQAGIDYEVVPGVSSAVAVPAYAGIPVTHRLVSAQFTVVTGRPADGGAVDWDSLPRTGTLVFLMGVTQLPRIAAELTARGFAAETPVAVIARGTTAEQAVVTGPLGDIVQLAGDLPTPATIVVGEVVRLREHIDWFEPGGPLALPTAWPLPVERETALAVR